MLAAIAVEREGMDAVIPETLDAARYLYMQELDDGSVCEELQVAGEAEMARAVISRGCRALICGHISPDTREALREQDVLCFDGYLYQAQQVRRLLYTGVLPGIK